MSAAGEIMTTLGGGRSRHRFEPPTEDFYAPVGVGFRIDISKRSVMLTLIS